MEQIFEQLKTYLKMDTEISYEEFTDFFKHYLDFIGEKYQQLDRDNLIKAKYTAAIIQSNAVTRAKRKGIHAKKYKKIGEKCELWAGALNLKLLEGGMSQQEIDKAEEQISASI